MLESVFQIRKTKKKCFLKGKHETKKCFQINKENRKTKSVVLAVTDAGACVLSGQVWLRAQI